MAGYNQSDCVFESYALCLDPACTTPYTDSTIAWIDLTYNKLVINPATAFKIQFYVERTTKGLFKSYKTFIVDTCGGAILQLTKPAYPVVNEWIYRFDGTANIVTIPFGF